MTNYTELIHALRYCANRDRPDCSVCEYEAASSCKDILKLDAAAAIEELDAEETRLLLLTSDLQDKVVELEEQLNDADVAAEDDRRQIEELQAEVKDLKRVNMELFEDLPKYGDKILHWVSVEERLPNVDEKVLVFAVGKLDGFIGDTVIALTSMSDTNWLNHHKKVDKPYWLDPWQYFLTDYRITHWMPLPEPPQEVQDGTE